MHFRHELDYDATPDEIFEMLADRAFRERVSDALDVVSHSITMEPRADGFTLVNDQVQRTEGLPAIARKFAGDTTRAVQREEWQDRSGGTREVVELDVSVRVPVIGGRLEALLADRLHASIDAEHEVGKAWLKGER